MTYIATELSVEDGSPIELYRFSNVLEKFLYTSGNREVTYLGEVYVPFPLKRTEPGIGSKKASSRMIVTADSTIPLAERYILSPPSTPDALVIYRQHYLDGAVETETYWTGSVATMTFKKDEVKISINPASKILDQAIPRRTYSAACNHVLFDGLCGVVKASWRSDVTVVSISADGLSIVVADDPAWLGDSATTRATADANVFNGGLCETAVGLDFRMIFTYDLGTETFVVPVGIQGLAVGDKLSLYAGCDRSPDVCFTKFDNITNFGGFPHVPTSNVFRTGIKTGSGTPGS